MIITELLQTEPFFIIRATLGEVSAHGSGITVEAAEDLAVLRARHINSHSPYVEPTASVVAPTPTAAPITPPVILPTTQGRVLNTGNSSQAIGPAAMAEGVRIAQLKAETDVDLKRLGWTNDYATGVLWHNWQKRKRGELTLDEYEAFAAYLKSIPTPE